MEVRQFTLLYCTMHFITKLRVHFTTQLHYLNYDDDFDTYGLEAILCLNRLNRGAKYFDLKEQRTPKH